MKHDETIRTAIDESLSSVHFNAHDARSVMRAVRKAPVQKARSSRRRSRVPDLAFAAAMLVLAVIPLSLFVLRAGRMQPVSVASNGDPIEAPQAVETFAPPAATAAPTAVPALVGGENAGQLSEEEILRIARECYEAHCDTGVFTFDEFTVQTQLSDPASGLAQYTVRMESLYGNGCSFTVVISAEDGEIIQYSTPALATQPTYLNSDSDEVRSWYAQYGAHAEAWPADVQAEFARRYRGGVLRTAKDGEISFAQAQEIAAAAVRDAFADSPGVYVYPSLYAERASEDGLARYVVLCYAQELTDETNPAACARVSIFASDGTVESVEILESAP